MTYDLTIGKLAIERTTDDTGAIETYALALDETHPAAPAFPGAVVSARRNHVCIPWGYYADTRNMVANYDPCLSRLLFTGTNASVIIPVTSDLIAAIRDVILAIKREHPAIRPDFDSDMPCCIFAWLMVLYKWCQYSHRKYRQLAVIQVS